MSDASVRTAPPMTASYRLQVNAEFPLSSVRELVPYLDGLGISHIYTSPVLAARQGSTHGYDVVDPAKISPELGGESERLALVEAIHERNMGWMLDIVPNHMAASPENPYWESVLASGRASAYASWFDIDWEPPQKWLRGRVMLPVLGAELDEIISRDELRLCCNEGELRLQYGESTFPLSPESQSQLRAISSAPGPECNAAAARFSEGEKGRRRIRELLDRQHYALAFWRRASKEINYRRFFEIDDLVGVRVEDPKVFDATHALVLDWVADGALDALRIDHIDGLFDPAEYLERLKRELRSRRAPDAVNSPLYVEKILQPGEQLRDDWPVEGTTGYDALAQMEAVFIDPAGADAVESAYRAMLRLRENSPRFADVARRGKFYVLRGALEADVRRTLRLLEKALRARKEKREQRRSLHEALIQLIAALPVYRTYLTGGIPPEADERLIAAAALEALSRDEELAPALASIVDLLVRLERSEDPGAAGARRGFVGLFQQVSSPAAAKGVEDTALYIYAPLASRNEVGSDPGGDLTDAISAFHRSASHRSERWPHAILTADTHDTKRSADTRARLDVLSEIPAEWNAAVRRWRIWNRPHRTRVKGRFEPDANTEYCLYQALIGIWPHSNSLDRSALENELPALGERLLDFIRKATREAKMRTTWTEPDASFERALEFFVSGMLAPSTPFLTDVAAFVARIAPAGFCNSLSRVLLNLASPGIPDIYQGNELWSFALVDPDNRRAVDFASRHRVLEEVEQLDAVGQTERAAAVGQLVQNSGDGRIKFLVTRTLLRERRAAPEFWREASYRALVPEGIGSRHLLCFAREHRGHVRLAIATRLAFTLARESSPTGEIWGNTLIRLPAELGDVDRWTCGIAGHYVRVLRDDYGPAIRAADALAHAPVALLGPLPAPAPSVRYGAAIRDSTSD